jgi:hypothetical protein
MFDPVIVANIHDVCSRGAIARGDNGGAAPRVAGPEPPAPSPAHRQK